MKYEKDEISLEKGIEKEWIITNGIGGYSSSTIIGANTRKYHGLLVAPMMPPGSRHLILSKVDEAIIVDGKAYGLYTNVCKDNISDGYKHLKSFEKEYIPIFTYQVEDILIKKFICLEHGKNTVGIYYYIKNGEKAAKLTLAPVVNFRGFHTTNTSEHFDVKQEIENNKVSLIIDNNSQHPIYTYVSEGRYIKHENDIFHNMYYIEEEKRGQGAVENHVVPGVYEVDIEPNEDKYITFVCSLEQNIEEKSKIDEMRKQFISDVSHELKTPIALIQGYAEGLLENVNTDDESRKFYAEVILDESNKMDTLVKQLLELMKLEYGKREFNNENFDIVELINEVIRKCKVMLEEKNIDIVFQSDSPILVNADDFYVERVVTNYFTNAIKHTIEVNKEKKIEIKIEEKEDKIRISVFNTGNKIAEENLNKIWGRFYKEDSSRNRTDGGTGIGLALVKAIMTNYKNDYGVINKENGVEFYFELDKEAEEKEERE